MEAVNIISASESLKYAYENKINIDEVKLGFKLKKKEVESLQKFIEILKENDSEFSCFNGYYIGYQIKQISKEFDLLRFGSTSIINIELKGVLDEEIKVQKIIQQMNKNYYYLNFSQKKIIIFTYVEDDGFYKYDKGSETAVKVSNNEVVSEIERQVVDCNITPDKLFVPSNYLISPFNNTESFLEGGYFLTDHQFNIKKEILELIHKEKYNIFCISANAGTGKTLLAYDIVKSCMNENKNARIIHCGKLNEGHHKLHNHGWKITAIRNINNETINLFDKENLSVVVIDEAHRIRGNQLDIIIEKSMELNLPVVILYDAKQALSKGEDKDIFEYIQKKFAHIPLKIYTLSSKIRSNKEIASFIKNLIHIGHSKDSLNYDNITVDFFEDIRDVKEYVTTLSDIENWKAITFTSSQYVLEPLSKVADICTTNAHDVIGQEFKKVVFVMDSNFKYDEQGVLMYNKNNYYDSFGMLYQIVTRATDQLKIIVLGDYPLFLKLLEIKHCMFL